MTGFGPGGELLGEGGVPMTDNAGNPLTNANAASMAGSLAGEKALAQRVAANGLSNQEGSAGVPVGALGNFGGVSPTAAPVETSATPRPGNLRGLVDALLSSHMRKYVAERPSLRDILCGRRNI